MGTLAQSSLCLALVAAAMPSARDFGRYMQPIARQALEKASQRNNAASAAAAAATAQREYRQGIRLLLLKAGDEIRRRALVPQPHHESDPRIVTPAAAGAAAGGGVAAVAPLMRFASASRARASAKEDLRSLSLAGDECETKTEELLMKCVIGKYEKPKCCLADS
uniref:Uncharacterized protein n=1 Tax=Lotharella oceanica TaxID=641309 RepID=A0A7S2X6T8_9EUKA|mmetsp:Transcript_13504/g.25756  ORF Transcript_13504/g.25756 Transcript_13504/m.25756 type:complete len:165 (+) Transcript_13504:3-497(+)